MYWETGERETRVRACQVQSNYYERGGVGVTLRNIAVCVHVGRGTGGLQSNLDVPAQGLLTGTLERNLDVASPEG